MFVLAITEISISKLVFYSYIGWVLHKFVAISKYPGNTRPEFKMWGGASKSVFVLVLKICQHQFASKTLSCKNNNLHPAL